MLHSSTLSQYWRNKRIPKGLRINKALSSNNPAFCKKWCEVLNMCFHCTWYCWLLNVLKRSYRKCDWSIRPNFISQQMRGVKWTLYLFNWFLSKKKLKVKKYQQDTLDYKNDWVYSWQSGWEDEQERRPVQSSCGMLHFFFFVFFLKEFSYWHYFLWWCLFGWFLPAGCNHQQIPGCCLIRVKLSIVSVMLRKA